MITASPSVAAMRASGVRKTRRARAERRRSQRLFEHYVVFGMSGKGSRTPYFLVFAKVDGKWGVAMVRSVADIE